MYRVLLFFRVLEYNLVVSLLTTTMVRNFVYIIYTAHWAGALRVQSTRECGRHCMPHHAALLPDEPQASTAMHPRTHEVVSIAGCGFFFIASQEHLTESTWLGMYPDLLAAWPSKFDR